MSLSTQIKVLGGLPTAGSPPAASSLSADEIAALLGFADAAAMVAASVQYVLATGGTTNYVASPALALTPVNGTRIAVRFPSNCAANATLNVSGSGAKAIMLRTLAGERATTADDLLSGGTYIFTYMEDFGGLWVSMGGAHLKAADIPSTLNATTIGTVLIASLGGQSFLQPAPAISGSFLFCGGQAGGYSKIELFSADHATKPGDVEYYTGTASGAAHSFFDKNGVEQLRVDENGVTSYGDFITSSGIVRANTITAPSSVLVQYSGSAAGKSSLSGGNNTGNGAEVMVHGPTHATYPGAHQQFAPLSTRAASTAFAVCPVATGDRAYVTFMAETGNACSCAVDESGTVTTYDTMPGFTASAGWVSTSSPSAGQVGLYVSAGVFYCKPGSSFTGKIASFSRIGKA